VPEKNIQLSYCDWVYRGIVSNTTMKNIAIAIPILIFKVL